MKEIKSVRLRKTNDNIGSLDIKVTLYEDKKNISERVLIGTNNSNSIWLSTRYKKVVYLKSLQMTNSLIILYYSLRAIQNHLVIK
jgi:hypothetical protein